ncbi:MAG: CSLREA domain-containing protein [Acidobacteriota bacterium]
MRLCKGLLGIYWVVIWTIVATAAGASTLTVNTLADGPNADDSACTLREAIASANANADVNAGFAACRDAAAYGTDTIRFALGGTITVTTTLPSFTDGARTTVLGDIDGDGDLDVTVSGGGSALPFEVDPGAQATLDHMAVVNGHSGVNGGGIRVFGSLNLLGCTVSGNTSDGYGAGVVVSVQGALIVNGCLFNDNIAGHDGGAIETEGGSVTVVGSRFVSNGARSGGAIFTAVPTSVISITGSELTGNTATSFGGAISTFGTLFLFGSTLSGNAAAADGGGIYQDGGAFTAANSTLSGNTAVRGGGFAIVTGEADLENVTIAFNAAPGGGGAIFTGSSDLTLSNTLVAQSVGTGNCGGPGAITDGTVNLDDGSTCGFGAGSLNNASPGLAPLGNNGGPTATHALLPGSAAIDAGLASACASLTVADLDQRRRPRPVDGDGDGSAACDIGAFEADPLPVIAVPALGAAGETLLALTLLLLAARRLRRHAGGTA